MLEVINFETVDDVTLEMLDNIFMQVQSLINKKESGN